MSTFSGFLDEIEYVSIDRFTQLNFRSKAFFLSHCHTDHMIGLNEINSEVQLPGSLYLSEISKVIVQRRYPAVKNLVILKIGEATPISFAISECDEIDQSIGRTSVTAIPAGHCPGSVMFLFEQGNKRILYTGDFRLYREDIEGIIALKKFHENINLDCLYLDSTFLSLDYAYFPKQRESINTIIELTEKWLEANPKNIVYIRPPANYGYEFLLVQLSQYFKVKIHVTNATFKDYVYIPDIDTYISNNPYHCGRIHLCPSGNANQWKLRKSLCLPKLDERHICIIRPTAMKWRKLAANDIHYESHAEVPNSYSVCYSNHSSHDEIKFLIQYLRPKIVKLNVVPNNVCQKNAMYGVLDEITKEYQTDEQKIDMEVQESKCIEYNFHRITSIATKSSISLEKDEISLLKVKKRRRI
ncbi:protein artemis-like isoform X1 [Sitodiplosis mosellana]|uniref:protein artemis-like isoform X1 n=1 Tax=Sitodiplosis mosellana TaxID=263140 RepID=UPI00244517A2|nr:protein artemis-like isoform X1 [Sitodiplosis mosellana]